MKQAQKQHGRRRGARGAAIAAVVASLLLVPGVSVAFAASAVLGGIDIAGSEKGLLLTLSADAPFSTALQQKGAGKNGLTAVVSIRCSQAIYGLDEFSFTEFPAACPVRRIAVNESPASGSIELLVGLTIAPDKQLRSKQKGNKWIILLSREPSESFSWSAVPPPGGAGPSSAPARPPSAPQGAQASQGSLDNGQSRLADITMLARDRVERFTFQFDRATVMRVKREADRFVILFVNAASSLAAQRFTSPSAQLSGIELKQVAHGGTMWLGASLYLKDPADAGVVLQAFSDRLVIYCATDSLQRLSVWSARTGPGMSYRFVKIPQFEPDYRGMEEKAKNDLATTVSEGASTFAIGDAERQPAKAAPVQEQARASTSVPAAREETVQKEAPAQPSVVTKEPVIVRLLIVKNNVNLRSGPSSSDSVLCRLPIGTAASPLAKQGGWVKIGTGSASGWVTSAMVVDSSRAPKELLDKVAELRTKQLEKLAAEEKAAATKAEKEELAEERKAQKQKQVEEQQAQKQKQVEEQQAKKQAERAARETQETLAKEKKAQKDTEAQRTAQAARARDSVLKYNAAKQDSLEKAKRNQGPKLVEYHVYGRDPFLPLSRDQDSPVPNVEDLNLVGILYDQADRIGLFENKRDQTRAYALRENDPIENGYVLRVQPDKVLFLINEMGISRTYALKLTKEKQ
jgi:hypothetical protein